jgi:excisionase family DNA binding protein
METSTENHDEPIRLLTLKETAELLQVSGRTVWRLVQQKELPAFKVGAQWRFRESDLTQWLQGRVVIRGQFMHTVSAALARTPME